MADSLRRCLDALRDYCALTTFWALMLLCIAFAVQAVVMLAEGDLGGAGTALVVAALLGWPCGIMLHELDEAGI